MAQTLGFSGNGDPCNLAGIWERTPPVPPSPDRISRTDEKVIVELGDDCFPLSGGPPQKSQARVIGEAQEAGEGARIW